MSIPSPPQCTDVEEAGAIGAAIAAMRSGNMLEFCRFLNAVREKERQAGAVPEKMLSGSEASLAIAERLGLLRHSAGQGGRLTADGVWVAYFAMQYCNWSDEGKRLPEGLTPELVRGKSLLDVGCSGGCYLVACQEHGAIGHGIDISEQMLEFCAFLAEKEGVQPPKVQVAPVEAIPYPAHSFDIVLCRLVLSYSLHVSKAMSELARVMKAGGELLLGVETLEKLLWDLRHTSWIRNPKAMAWKLFAVANTLCFQSTGKQVRIRFSGRQAKTHSPVYPSVRFLKREFGRCGLHLAEQRDRGNGFYVLRFVAEDQK